MIARTSFLNSLSSGSRCNTWSCLAFNCYASLISFNLVPFPSLHLLSTILTFFKRIGQLFCRISLNLGLSDVSSRLDSGYTSFFLIFFFYWFQRERKWGRKCGRETSMWERNIDRLPLTRTPSGTRTCNPGMCPDWESNLWPSVCRTMPKQLNHTG